MYTTNWSEVWNLWKSESIHSDVLTSLTEVLEVGVDKCFCHPNDSQYSGLFLTTGITNNRPFVLCETVMVFCIYRTATNMVTNQQGSVAVHQQILALASMPFGDSPLFRNLLPVSFILNVMFV
jgi:hypothetical protein